MTSRNTGAVDYCYGNILSNKTENMIGNKQTLMTYKDSSKEVVKKHLRHKYDSRKNKGHIKQVNIL